MNGQMLAVLNELTTAEIVMILEEDSHWSLPGNARAARQRMEEARVALLAGAAAVAAEHRTYLRDISTEAA